MSDLEARDPISWLLKIDENSKALDALLIALAGALIAFVADYVKDSSSLDSTDRVLAAAGILLSALSLTFGLLRSWLRQYVYEGALAALKSGGSSEIYKSTAATEEQTVAKKRAEILAKPGLTDAERAQQIGQITADIFDKRFDDFRALLANIVLQAKSTRRIEWMERLFGPQILTFALGALALAAIVLKKLAT